MKNNGVAHRDVKSENIIINPDTLLIKFIDFGLGMRVEDEFTKDSEFIGTPIYMAPEVLHRKRRFSVSIADLWSCGIVFLEMLLGHHPFKDAETEGELIEMQEALDFTLFSPAVQDILNVLLYFYCVMIVSPYTYQEPQDAHSSQSIWFYQGSNLVHQSQRFTATHVTIEQ